MKNYHRKRIGRPQLGVKKRCHRITANFTLEEKNRIENKANEAKISLSDFLHRAALNREISAPLPPVNLEALSEINAIGKNLNLLTRASFSGCRIDLQSVERYFVILSELKALILEKS